MKKLLAILLAALMIFSVTTVAFAEGDEDVTNDAEVVETEGDAEAEDGFDFMDLPIWTIKVGGHAGKIFLKIAIAIVRVLSKLGLIDGTELIQGLIDQIQGNTDDAPVDGGETAEPVAEPAA